MRPENLGPGSLGRGDWGQWGQGGWGRELGLGESESGGWGRGGLRKLRLGVGVVGFGRKGLDRGGGLGWGEFGVGSGELGS